MSIDNTHTKYLKGKDKDAWNNFKEAYKTQNDLDNFLGGFKVPEGLKEGEVYDIPVRKNQKKNKKDNNNK